MKGKLPISRALWKWIGAEELDRGFYWRGKIFEDSGIKKKNDRQTEGWQTIEQPILIK